MSRPNRVSHKLKDVVRRELAVELDKEHQKANWGGQLTDEMLAYAANDTKVLPPLADALTFRAKEAKLELTAEIERRALPAIAWMANTGLPFDRKGWTRHLKGLEKDPSPKVGEYWSTSIIRTNIRPTRTSATTPAISDGILTLRFGLGRVLRTVILDLFTTL